MYSNAKERYNDLINELGLKLRRDLSGEEKKFIEWIAQQAEARE